MDARTRDGTCQIVRRAGRGAAGAGIAVAALLLATSGTPPARGEGCDDPPSPAALAEGQPLSAALPSGTAHHYALEVDAPDTVVTVVVDDAAELAPVLVSSCAVAAQGGGRHLDGDDWQRVGDAWVVSFDVEEHDGTYFVTVAPDPGTTAFPVAYEVGWAAE